mgnify:CR=1 FL=1
MIKVGIIGSSGYVAGELIRCLVFHSEVKIDFLYSTSNAGLSVDEIHEDIYINQELSFTDKINYEVDVLFLCLGHGNSVEFLSNHTFSEKTVVIDLSNDFRLASYSKFKNKDFVYGLVELNKSKIETAQSIANPGCFATAIQLGIIPLAKNQLLKDDIHVNAITGSTGAGQSFTKTSHFSWRNNNISVYKPFTHQHLDEIYESIKGLHNEFDKKINFIPTRGDFTRGIFATMYTKSDLSESQLLQLYSDCYSSSEFTYVTNKTVNLKQVVNTNNCLIQVKKIDDLVLVTSVIDNLLKGAAGQAIQNMNIIFGLEESTGLKLKANYH